MKKIIKKFLSATLALIILAGVLPLGGMMSSAAASYAVGDIIEFGCYAQEQITDSHIRARLAEQTPDSYGRIYYDGEMYFKYRSNEFYEFTPIRWRVLSSGSDGLYVLAENVLDCVPYHNSYSSITWQNCTLRSYLNSTFYNIAFDDSEKNLINLTHLVNGNNPDYGTSGGAATDDYVFVPSLADVLDPSYGFANSTYSSATRQANATSFAVSKGCSTSNSVSGFSRAANWWLRTPGYISHNACLVRDDGSVDDYCDVSRTNIGVRPALKLNLQSGIFQSSTDYVIKFIDEKTGAAVSGVGVSCAGVQYTGAADGKIKISVKNLVVNSKLTASKKGYGTKEIAISTLKSDRVNIITLSSDDPFGVKNQLENINFGSAKVDGPSFDLFGETVYFFSVDLGVAINIADFSIKSKYDEKNETLKIIIGIKDGVEVNNYDDFMEEYENFKDFFAISNQKTNYEQRQAYKKIQDKLEKRKGLAGINLDMSVAGFATFDVSDGTVKWDGEHLLESGITVTASGKYTQEFPFWYIFYATFSAGAELGFTSQYDCTNTGSWAEGLSTQISFSPFVSVGAGAKALSKKVAYVEAGLEGKLIMSIDVPADSLEDSLTVKLTGKAYYEAALWKLSKKGTIAGLEGEVLLFPKGKANAKSAAAFACNGVKADELTLESRDYLNFRNNGSMKKSKAAAAAGNTFEKSAVYPKGFPKLAVCNGGLVAVWTDDDGTKTGANANTLYYTYYNGTSWSTPAPVFENGTSDFEAEIYSDGNNVYAVWQRATEEFGDDVSIEDYAANTELVYSSFIGTSWSSPVTVGNSNALALGYSIIENNGEVTVAWIENSENDYFLEQGTNSVYTSTLSSGVWGSPVLVNSNLGTVESLNVGLLNGATCTVYISDGIVYANNVALTDATQECSSATYQSGEFYWLCNGKLVKYDGTVTELSINASPDYKVVKNAGTTAILYTVANGFTDEVFITYKDGETYTAPVAFTNYGKHIGSFDAIMNDDGTISIAADVRNLADSNADYPYTTTDFVIDKIGETVNISVDGTARYDNAKIVPNGTATFTTDVTNKGTADVSSFDVALLDENNNVLASKTVLKTVLSGETAEVSVDYTLPATISRTNVTMTVSAENDIDSADNSATASFGYADIVIENCAISDNGLVMARVFNQGFETAENVKANVKKFDDGYETLTTVDFGTLAPGARKSLTYTVDDENISFSQTVQRNLFTIEFDTETDELLVANNSTDVSLYPTEVSGVALNKEALSLIVGGEYTLFADVAPLTAFDKSVTWLTDDSSVATVDENGKVTAIGIGEATITAVTSNDEVFAHCVVTVTESVLSVPVTGIVFDRDELYITAGGNANLVATVSPSNATNPEVIWHSANEDVAMVTQSGRVIAISIGTTTITATTADGNFTATCEVTIIPASVPVVSVAVAPTSKTLEIDETQQLAATVNPTDATNKAVTWESSDTAVATVSSTGLVTAKAAGTATITVTTADGSKTATCAITVSNPTITIKNLNNSASINYGDTLRLTAVTTDMPAGAKVVWSVDGTGVSLNASDDGRTCDITSTASGTVTVTAKIVDASGTPITDADENEISVSQQIKSNAGFFQKLIAFFKKLFGSTKIIVQSFIDD